MEYCLYAWGANSHGQLGLGYQSEQSLWPVELSPTDLELDFEKIEKITGGGGHSLILDKDGIVYSCGWNKKGQTGIPTSSESLSQFTKINSLSHEKIINIACGWDSSIAVTNSGEIYVWGSNVYGQLGLDPAITGDFLNTPHKIQSLGFKVKTISMGLRHSAIVSEDGNVFVTGSNSKFQLGLDTNDDKKISRFTLVPGLENIVGVSCGQYFTLALTKDSIVYSWGDNKYGQLGFDPEEIRNLKSPTEIYFLCSYDLLRKVECGWTHSIAFDRYGGLWSWGRNVYGQLGYQHDDGRGFSQAKCIQAPGRIRRLEVGSEHNTAIDANGRVLSWGWNEHGNCGTGGTKNVFTSINIQFPAKSEACVIGNGAGHSFAVIKKKKLFKRR